VADTPGGQEGPHAVAKLKSISKRERQELAKRAGLSPTTVV